jgi:hypothetical protein
MSESVETNKLGKGDKPWFPSRSYPSRTSHSNPELEGNIRTLVWDSASARKAVDGEDDQLSAGDLAASLRETSRVSIAEVDRLIAELQTLRRKLQTDGARIERDIMQHVALSEQATKLTQIVFEGVKQLPTRA